jgi:adenine-specific DNA-methyltransferase
MLSRIIEASSNAGDIVLDCFSGSGASLGVADELDRKWIGIDNSFEAVKTTLRRFHEGTKPMGDFVTKHLQSETNLSPIQEESSVNFILYAEESELNVTAEL